ncbi:MAG: S46 family peptidase [Paraprevotella sp.]|nr:S46 family peptidase [Paraprevotella sp.]
MLCKAILEMEMDQPHYSDANFTMRLSYGFVDDDTSTTGLQNFFTTMPSLLDKVAQSNTIEEYKLEPNIKDLFEKGDFGPYKDKASNEMQLCFLTNNDITGGNSGSPMFNGKGELIGLAFDGNWDAMSNDISYTQDLTRCIGVDIRYVLYIIDRWGGAERLIKEINAQ